MQPQYTSKILAPGDDLADAFSVRMEVFVREQGFSADQEFDATDPVAHHVVLYDGDLPVGTGRVFPSKEPGLYVLGRIAVRQSCRGGTGRLLMERMEELARRLEAAALTLGAQCRVRGFYEKLGYTAYGDEYMDEHCPHIHMKKVL